MTKKNNKNIQTTYDRVVGNMSPARRKKFEEEYRELVLSELLIALMEEDDVSVRKLAHEAGLSSAIIQGIRSGTKENITLQSFLKILHALDCSLLVKKNQHVYPLELARS
jgi:DNA-binding Xre family transcriptional regulator